MKAAAKNDNADLVNFCIHKGADDFNMAMVFAACCGHTDIVRLMIEHGADGFNAAMVPAAEGGHIDVVL